MRKELEKLLEENQGTIVAEVIQEALDSRFENPIQFFEDLFQHGCQSGMISSLIRYTDTHKFYDKYYNEIEDIRYELQEEWILPQVQSDLKNHYAWLSFEHRAYEVYNQLEMEGR